MVHVKYFILNFDEYLFLKKNFRRKVRILCLTLNVVHKFSKILADIKNVEKPSIWSPTPCTWW